MSDDGFFKPRALLQNEARIVVVFTREFDTDGKRIQEISRLEAYGRALDHLGYSFIEAQLPPLAIEPEAFLTLYPLAAAMSGQARLPCFTDDEDMLQDIVSWELSKTRPELRNEAHSQLLPLYLDAYLLTDPQFVSEMNSRGSGVQDYFEKQAKMFASCAEALLVSMDSCSLTVGLLALLSNNTPTEREKLVNTGRNSHPHLAVQPVNEESLREVDKPLAVELIFTKDGALTDINYLNDSNFVPLGKAKPPPSAKVGVGAKP